MQVVSNLLFHEGRYHWGCGLLLLFPHNFEGILSYSWSNFLKHWWILIRIVLSQNAYSVKQTSHLNQTGACYCMACFCWQHLIPINFYWWEIRGSIAGTSEFGCSLHIKEPAFLKHVQELCCLKVTACSGFEVWYCAWCLAFGENTNL